VICTEAPTDAAAFERITGSADDPAAGPPSA
jgi:hypothetical protein